jgi:hypothetical protein
MTIDADDRRVDDARLMTPTPDADMTLTPTPGIDMTN